MGYFLIYFRNCPRLTRKLREGNIVGLEFRIARRYEGEQ
jgi:hypothetical protein